MKIKSTEQIDREINSIFISTVAKVEDLWRFWSKVTDSVTECVTKVMIVDIEIYMDLTVTSNANKQFTQCYTGQIFSDNSQ